MTEEEARILAWTLLGEAGGEGLSGMTAVAHVLRNRAASGRFPSNPASVALQANSRGVYQFSTWNPISNGGNIPRARYPVGSEDFNKALSVVEKVFGDRPGRDPTQGATHYYSPKGMEGGLAPYWWRSEAPKGEKRIGSHVFAIKYDPKEAPVPRNRPGGQDPIGHFPEEVEMRVLRTGAREKLPVIGPRYTPTPAKQSLALQMQRENAGATVRSSQTLIYDPVKQTLVPAQPTAAEVKRSIGQSVIERSPPAKTVQRVAGFTVRGGTEAITQMDKRRELEKQAPTYAREPLPPSRAQTQFANSTLPQAAGTVNNSKNQERLTTTGQRPPTMQGGPYSRDAAARMAVNNGIEIVGPPKVAPVPQDRIQRPPVRVVAPPQSDQSLRIVVQRDPVVRVIAKTPVEQLRDSGMSPEQAYNAANAAARDRAESGGKYTSDNNNSGSVGSRSYDADTNTWR